MSEEAILMDTRKMGTQNPVTDIENNDGGEVCIYPARVYKNGYLHSAMMLLCLGIPTAIIFIPGILSIILDEQAPNRTAIIWGTGGTTAAASISAMGSILFFGTKKNPRMDNEEAESLKYKYQPQMA
jgi:hypothetical protein